MNQEKVDANRDRRPLYKTDDRVEVVTKDSVFTGWHGRVLSIRPMQTVAGFIATYLYELEMDNLARHTWSEEQLAKEGGA